MSFFLRAADSSDIDIAFLWANDPVVRKYAFNKQAILWEDHQKWFLNKINNSDCYYFILNSDSNQPAGSIRFDKSDVNSAIISYLIAPVFHGKGLGTLILQLGIEKLQTTDPTIQSVIGFVLDENIASVKIFNKLGFTQISVEGNLIKFKKEI